MLPWRGKAPAARWYETWAGAELAASEPFRSGEQEPARSLDAFLPAMGSSTA